MKTLARWTAGTGAIIEEGRKPSQNSFDGLTWDEKERNVLSDARVEFNVWTWNFLSKIKSGLGL